jgi:sarcosine oxidase
MRASDEFDVVVIGLGVTGVAALAELAGRGARVLGIDRFTPPHPHGSSHGDTRITREIYYERPLYVPLVQRARAQWRELERRTGRRLFVQTGGLNIGAPDCDLVSGASASALEYGLAHEVLSAEHIRHHFPGLCPDHDMIGIYEPTGGVLLPESCISALHESARRAGARLRYDESVTGIERAPKLIEVVTSRTRYRARRIVLAAGAWLPALLPDLELPLVVERQVMLHFASRSPGVYAAERFPFTLWYTPAGATLYTCPDVGAGLKAALHHGGETVDPDHVRRAVDAAEVAEVRALLSPYFPEIHGEPIGFATCLYTTTPDFDFILDLDPHDARVVIASACSGHGFKFGPAVGEIVADLALSGEARWDIGPFSLSRFASARGPS